MNANPQTSKEYFKLQKVIYFAMIAGQIIFVFTSLFYVYMGMFNTDTKELRDIFIIIAALFVLGGILGSKIIFQNRLKIAKDKNNLKDKMFDYRAALIVRYAVLEGPSFFSIVSYLLTGDLLFLAMSGLIIIVFFTILPTPQRASSDLELSYEDNQLIINPDAIIA